MVGFCNLVGTDFAPVSNKTAVKEEMKDIKIVDTYDKIIFTNDKILRTHSELGTLQMFIHKLQINYYFQMLLLHMKKCKRFISG